MNLQIALLLGQDGLTNGAIYALLALALVLVFTVTRVILIPQGEFVSYGALTLAGLQLGRVPGTLWLLLAAAFGVGVLELFGVLRNRRPREVIRVIALYFVAPALLGLLTWWLAPQRASWEVQVLL